MEIDLCVTGARGGVLAGVSVWWKERESGVTTWSLIPAPFLQVSEAFFNVRHVGQFNESLHLSSYMLKGKYQLARRHKDND